MIHKPTNAFPYNTVVNLDDYPDKLNFSAAVYNSSPITNARLTIRAASQSYFFSDATGSYKIIWALDENSDQSNWVGESYRNPKKSLWDSWMGSWINFKTIGRSSYRRFYKFEYDSSTDSVTAFFKGDITIDTPDGTETCSCSHSTTPTASSYRFYFGDKEHMYNNWYDGLYTYSQQLSGTGISLARAQFDTYCLVSLGCAHKTSYMSKTDPADNTGANRSIYGYSYSILQPNRDYSWQVRLYEASGIQQLPNNCIGYGFISNAGTGVEGKPLQIRPHTTIECNTTEDGKHYHYIEGGQVHTLEKYYIVINGKVGQITEFWNSNISRHSTSVEADSYGDALYGYALVNWQGDPPSVSQNDRYAIYCNYIDSDEFYFSTTDRCQLELSYLSENNLSSSLSASEINLSRSDLQVTGKCSNPYGAILNRYRILLYKIDGDTEILVDDTEYVQDSHISYSYNKMYTGEKYRMEIEAVDTNSYVIQKSFIFNVKYNLISNSYTADTNDLVRVDSYREHGSVIVDWTKSLKFFNDTGNTSYEFAGFDVYKTIGSFTTLYQVADRNITGVIEDFLIGDRAETVYHIYPIYVSASGEQIQMPIISQPTTISHEFMKLMGLNALNAQENRYEVDLNNVWTFGLNLSDNGATIVNAKAFTDTQSRFSKETIGATQYISKQVGGLLGKIDCSNDTGEYLDTYDDIVNWRSFVAGSQLKAFVDLRGIVYICDVESNPTDTYNEELDYADTVNFTIHEIDSLDYLSVFAREIEYNPLSFMLLADGDGEVLQDAEPLCLSFERKAEA